ncbi:hypothetical protein ABZZ80_28425 [Streptomyces sp. NPDC006356]
MTEVGKERRVPPTARIAEFPKTAAEQARWRERHILEVLDGLPPDAPAETVPRPEFDPKRNSLAQRERAKAAELTAAGHAMTASGIKQRRRRSQAQLPAPVPLRPAVLVRQTQPLPPRSSLGHPGRALQRALADVASPRRRTKPNVRYPRAIPLADRPELALRIRETAQSGNATIRDLSRRHKLPPWTIRTILDMPAPSTYQSRSGPKKGRPARRPAAAINDSTRVLIDTMLAEHLDLREVWTRLMDDHDISVSYSSINIRFRTRPRP